MIEGSVRIVGPAPAMHLDPFRLAAKQPEQTDGYIEIFYPGTVSEAHLLFLRGGKVCSAARLARHGRCVIGENWLRREFTGREVDPLVSLHRVPSAVLGMMMAIFSYEPSLNVRLERMPRGQAAKLLERAWSPPCLVEIARWCDGPPELLVEYVGEPAGFAAMRSRLSRGTLRLYEIAPNAEPPARRTTAVQEPDLQQPSPPQPEPPLPEVPSGKPKIQSIVAQTIGELTKPVAQAGTAEGGCSQGLADEFARIARRCLGPRSERILSQAAAEVQKSYQEFRPSELTGESMPALFAFIEQAVGKTILGRRRLRAAAAPMLSEFYSAHHDELQRHKLLRRAEELYRSLTKGF